MDLESAIQHLKESIADPTHKWGCEECKQEHEQLLEWLEDYKRLQSVSSWIPCSDRLPKETGLLNGYLCSIGDCITIMPFFDGKFQAWMDNGKFIVPDPYVEFWMPLPKSPEEEVK